MSGCWGCCAKTRWLPSAPPCLGPGSQGCLSFSQPLLPPLAPPGRTWKPPLWWSSAVVASLCCWWCLSSNLGFPPVSWVRPGFCYPHFRKKDRTAGGGGAPRSSGSRAVSACPQRLGLFVLLSSGPVRPGGAAVGSQGLASPSSPSQAQELIGRCTELQDDVTEKGWHPGRPWGNIFWVAGEVSAVPRSGKEPSGPRGQQVQRPCSGNEKQEEFTEYSVSFVFLRKGG